MEDPVPSVSSNRSSHFRTSSFFSKLSHFKASWSRRKGGEQRGATPYNARNTRSLDPHGKHYVSQPSLITFQTATGNVLSSDRESSSSPSSNGAVSLSHTRSMPPSSRQFMPTQEPTQPSQTNGLPASSAPSPQTIEGLPPTTNGSNDGASMEEFVVVERPKGPAAQIQGSTERPKPPDIRIQTSSPVISHVSLIQPIRDGTASRNPPKQRTPPVSAPSEHPSRSSTLPLPPSPTRRIAPRLNELPPTQRFSLGAFTDNERGLARLSPFILTRQPPMPLKNLPTLRPLKATPDVPVDALSRSRSAARLRHMPALPMEGHTDEPTGTAGDNDDHELTIDDEDEDDEEMFEDAREGAPSDDGEDVDGPQGASTNSATATGSDSLPRIDTSRLDVTFIGGKESAGWTSPKGKGKAREDADRTPTPTRPGDDYFSSRAYPEPSSSSRPLSQVQTPRGPFQTPLAFPSEQAAAFKATFPRSPPPPRPNIYQHASKSMVNLLSSTKFEENEPKSAVQIKDSLQDGGLARIPPLRTDTYEDAHETLAERQKRLGTVPPYDGTLHPHVRRRQSMPTFHAGSPPPPYPDFPPFQKSFIYPREDEGREKLPTYSNDIYLKAIMPRKMEFIRPGIQAKDRKWRRVICELEGTVFRVYKCPASISGVGAISEWWENKVGVGDVSTSHPNPNPKDKEAEKAKNLELGRVSKLDEEARSLEAAHVFAARRSIDILGQSSSSQEASFAASTSSRPPLSTDHDYSQEGSRSKLKSLLKPSRPHGRSVSEIPNPPPPRGSPRPSLNIPRETRSSSVSSPRPSLATNSRDPKPPWASRSSELSSANLPDPDTLELIRAYTLQNAESGLGNDYIKRKCVIRLRMEGEQFLLQGKDIPEVIEWIEGFQAASNIALDLDARQMPKGPLFPRRRRRRAVRPTTQDTSSNS